MMAIAALMAVALTTFAWVPWSRPECDALRRRVEDLGGTLVPTTAGWQLVLHFGDHPSVPLGQLAELFGNLDTRSCPVPAAGIWHHPLSGEIVAAICKHPGIRSLSLVYAELTDDDVVSMHNLAQLEALNLHGSDLTRAPPLSKHACGRMHFLDLSRNKLAAGCFDESHAMPQLTHLDLHATQISDDSLPFIVACEALEYLDVAGCRLSEEAVSALCGLRQLKVLSVGGMGWSTESYLRLCELPQLEVLWIGLAQPQRHQVEEGVRKLGRRIILR